LEGGSEETFEKLSVKFCVNPKMRAKHLEKECEWTEYRLVKTSRLKMARSG